MRYFERETTGETLSRLTADVNAVQRATRGPTLGALVGLLTMFVYAAAMFVMEWRLTLLILVVVPGMVLISMYSARELRKRYRRVQETLADMNTTLEENLKGIRVSRAFARESDEVERFARDNTSNLRANMDTATVESVSTPSIQALSQRERWPDRALWRLASDGRHADGRNPDRLPRLRGPLPPAAHRNNPGQLRHAVGPGRRRSSLPVHGRTLRRDRPAGDGDT